METDLAPFFAGDIKVVARAGKINEVSVHILRHAMLLLAFEILARQFIGEGQPARSVDIG